jgi:hypothetical protein
MVAIARTPSSGTVLPIENGGLTTTPLFAAVAMVAP